MNQLIIEFNYIFHTAPMDDSSLFGFRQNETVTLHPDKKNDKSFDIKTQIKCQLTSIIRS